MNYYDPSKLPKPPEYVPIACRDLVYIGKGTNPSIAHTYNNGECFEMTRVEEGEVYTSRQCFGDVSYFSYYVTKDSYILEKMFPFDEEPIGQIIKEVRNFIINKLNGSLIDKSSILKAIHDEILSIANEKEQKELIEDIVI